MLCILINLVLKLLLVILIISFRTTLATGNSLEDNFLVNILLVDDGSGNEIADPGEPFVKIGQRFYIIHQGRKVSWHEAFYLCTTYGAQLTDIQNADEMQAITSYLLDMQVTDKDFFWTSGNTLMGPERVFTWANTGQRMSYTKWRSGQPDKALINPFCVHLLPETMTKTVHMSDWLCDKLAYFICVHPTANIAHNPNYVVDVKPAPPLEGLVQIGAKYYRIMDGAAVSWFQAENICNERNMHLAEIQNTFEMNAISDYLNKHNKSPKQFWVAGNDIYREGAFMWTSANKNIEVTYTKWSLVNPDNFLNIQHCIVLWKISKIWNMDDNYCETKFNFICQYPTQYPRYELIQR